MFINVNYDFTAKLVPVGCRNYEAFNAMAAAKKGIEWSVFTPHFSSPFLSTITLILLQIRKFQQFRWMLILVLFYCTTYTYFIDIYTNIRVFILFHSLSYFTPWKSSAKRRKIIALNLKYHNRPLFPQLPIYDFFLQFPSEKNNSLWWPKIIWKNSWRLIL